MEPGLVCESVASVWDLLIELHVKRKPLRILDRIRSGYCCSPALLPCCLQFISLLLGVKCDQERMLWLFKYTKHVADLCWHFCVIMRVEWVYHLQELQPLVITWINSTILPCAEWSAEPPPVSDVMRSDVSQFHDQHFTQNRVNSSQLPSYYQRKHQLCWGPSL